MPDLSIFVPQGSLSMPARSAPTPSKNPKKQPLILTPSHIDLLAGNEATRVGIYQLQLATAEQLRLALGYSINSLHRVQVLLKQLAEHEYVLRDTIFTKNGKGEYYYTLSRKGLNTLAAAGYDVRSYFRPSKETEKGFLFLQHTLSLNDVLIAAALLAKSVTDYSLSTFTHERILKQTPFRVKVERFVAGIAKEETVTLIPDAFLDFRHVKETGKEEKLPVLLELDRGTIEQKNFRKKIRAYIEFIKSERYKEAFSINSVTVAFATTQGVKRLEQMRDWSRKELAATNERGWLSNLFLFTALPDVLEPKQLFLAPVWYLPFDDDKPVSLLAD